ncbi:hypothetical protein [Nocardioides baekrokdamisoli]|uniref:hypothetical protein n=1 Tax=Nocardioides baekrokdamisoli TaxID=1804624 RepID=UPI0013DE49D6|nr:hypothetical protein [Nocardioides baekrokdamisoli]
MTDLERLAVAWESWSRKRAAVVHGLRLGPLIAGAVVTSAMVGGAVVKPMFG